MSKLIDYLPALSLLDYLKSIVREYQDRLGSHSYCLWNGIKLQHSGSESILYFEDREVYRATPLQYGWPTPMPIEQELEPNLRSILEEKVAELQLKRQVEWDSRLVERLQSYARKYIL